MSHLGTAKDPWGNEKLAFETEITINRKDFGLNWNAALETGGFLVGDDVKVSLLDSGRVTRTSSTRARPRRATGESGVSHSASAK